MAAFYNGRRVSREWQWVLLAAEDYRGRRLNVTSGRRTMAEQARLREAYERYKRGGPWAPLAAIPSPTAPHIRVGRADHALDIDQYTDAEWFDQWCTTRGMPLANTVPGEPWHKEAPSAAALKTFAGKHGRRPRDPRRHPVHRLKLSQRGVNLIAQWEGFRAEAYEDAAGHATIGFGTLLHYGPLTQADRKLHWTRERALQELEKDSAEAQNTVRTLVKVPLHQGEMDALTSFVYNVGAGAFRDSTLLRLLNDGRRAKAANQFLSWNRAGGKVLLGLSRRRRAERQRFLAKRPADD